MSFSEHESLAAQRLISLALQEDLGDRGDVTSMALISETAQAKVAFVARQPLTVAGLSAAAMVCIAVEPLLRFHESVADGTQCQAGQTLATVTGPLRGILAAERTALNFLQRLSGVATFTRCFVEAISGTKAVLLDTRKTTPGWRLLEKYAVRCGGGANHRMGLYDAILIKDNHIAGLGEPGTAVARAVELARAWPGNAGLPTIVEVDSLAQLEQVLPLLPEVVLLDNMTTEQLRHAVVRRDATAQNTLLEASGGVNLQTIRAIAETGVDRISVGAMTHSATATDIGLDYLTA
jgi:nicotinate-nucleotide pyrophosphorylase (carboxylating)